MVLFSAPVEAQWSMQYRQPPPPAWATILDPSRAAFDWSSAGIPGGVPHWTAVCQTVAPSGNPAGADLTNIEAALTACTNTHQVVQLTAGTYYLTGGLIFNNENYVALRGAGADQTKLVFNGNPANCIGEPAMVCVKGLVSRSQQNFIGNTAWTGGYAQGTTEISIASTSGDTASSAANPITASGITAPGNIIMLDQVNDSAGICPAVVPTDGSNCATAGIPGATMNGSTATIVTTMPHGFAVGDEVGIGLVNGYSAPDPSNTATLGYNSYDNSHGSCDTTNGCRWWPITDVGCIQAQAFVTAANCGASPLIAFQFSSSRSGMPPGGNTSTSALSSASATRDTGGVFVSAVTQASILENVTQGRVCPMVNYSGGGTAVCATGEVAVRSQTEVHRVVQVIDAQHIVIDPPVINTNWRSGRRPAVWWMNGQQVELGIEQLTVDYRSATGTSSSTGGIQYADCVYCWVKGVRSVMGNRNHIWLAGYDFRNQIDDNYIFGSQAKHSKSYGVEAFGATGTLVENNICQETVNCLMLGQDYGAVYAYNYTTDGNGTPTDWLDSQFYVNHDFASTNLFEGNNTNGARSDLIHGTSNQNVLFRNRLRGQDNPPRTNPTSMWALLPATFSRGYSFIGNVLNTRSELINYEAETPQPYGPGRTIFLIGVRGNQGYPPAEASTAASLMRWGNYDSITADANGGAPNGARWCGVGNEPGCSGGEVPTTAVPYINGNPVPATHALPNSFYLAAQPAWWGTAWGTPQFPPIGPDVTSSGALDSDCGGVPGQPSYVSCDGLDHKTFQIPAQVCFSHLASDTSYRWSAPIASSSWSGNVATFTFSNNDGTGNENVSYADVLYVTGVTPTAYNGIYLVVGAPGEANPPTLNTVSVALPQPGPLGAGTGGTLSIQNARVFNAATCYPGDFAYLSATHAATKKPAPRRGRVKRSRRRRRGLSSHTEEQAR